MIFRFWINAFIPKTVSGYTIAITTGANKGKTAIPLPGSARLNPGNLIKNLNAGYLTDQRSFDDSLMASHRMRSLVAIDCTGPSVVSTLHTSSGTTEVDTKSGDTLDFAVADMSRCSFSEIRARTAAGGGFSFSITYKGAAGDPLVYTAADIDYEGTIICTGNTVGKTLNVEWTGLLDEFPAYDVYCSLDGAKKTLGLFIPPSGNTVVDLLGPANRSVAGSVSFP
jgi:hypothetical protein